MALFSSVVTSAEENTPAFVDSSSHEVLLADPTIYRLGDRYLWRAPSPVSHKDSLSWCPTI